jgi:hypothetical protein
MEMFDPTYTPTMKDRIIPMLEAGMAAKEISEIIGCDKGYPYLVRKQIGMGHTPKQRDRSKAACNYEGPEGLKLLLNEYDNACKTINKVVDFLLKENTDLKEQVRQFNRITREATRPSWSPAVRNALVVHGD